MTECFDQLVTQMLTDPQKKSNLISLILDMILKGGTVQVENLDVGKFEIAEILVQNNFMRWKAENEPKVDYLGLVSTKDDDSSSSDNVPNDGSSLLLKRMSHLKRDDRHGREFSSGSSLDLSWNAGEITWYNPLRGAICEQWFNQYGHL